ncbi:MAG: class I SAM-dependent methyltransferase [Gemmatimonadota bacterium]
MTFELGACPVCNTTAFRMLADSDDMRRQREDLWEYHTRRLRAGAPVQQLFDRAIFTQDPPVHVVQCTGCGTVLRNPREKESSLVATYSEEQTPAAVLSDLFTARLGFFQARLRMLERLLGCTGSVLEVGSYAGAFLDCARARGWQAEGVDVNETANEFARARGATVHTGTIEQIAPDRRFDVIAFWNCLDQLPDPARALRHGRTLLDAGGILAVRVPNGGFYAALLGTPFATMLLAPNNLLAFPYRHGFTAGSLRTLLETADFRSERLRGDTLAAPTGGSTRRWAAAQERLLKAALRRLPARYAPWLEVYARAAPHRTLPS